MTKEQPLVSFLVIAYKQEEFIRDAIRGALAQTYEPLEVILSDDCSPDRTFEIIKEEAKAYHGPHRIVLKRNESNQGIAGNLNRALELAKGQFIIASAGDDISLSERTSELVKRWQESKPPVDMVCSYFEEIDETGKSTGFIKKDILFVPDTSKPVRQWTCGATGACVGYDRKLYDKFGPLDIRIVAEDWVFPFRAWVESGIALIEKPLVKHRTHDNSVSVIHRNVRNQKKTASRQGLRKKAVGNKLARTEDWFRSWMISDKEKNNRIESEFKQWIRLLELEWQAYNSSRLRAFGMVIPALGYRGGFKVAARLLVRKVLNLY